MVCTVDGDPECVDTDTDADNCGSCGHVCTGSQECCDGECVNPDTAYDSDFQNCGQCGHACRERACILNIFNEVCENGSCGCP